MELNVTTVSRGGHVGAPSALASQARIPCKTCGKPCRARLTRLCRTCWLALPESQRPSLFHSTPQTGATVTAIPHPRLVRPRQDLSWHNEAACTVDPDLFQHPYGETGEPKRARVAAAKAVCNTCPVLATCQKDALDRREPNGIWGGMSEDERQAILRRRRPSRRPKAESA